MASESLRLKNASFREQWRIVRRCFTFLAPVKFQVAVTSLVFLAAIAAEVVTVALFKPAVDAVQDLSALQQAGKSQGSAGFWEWFTAPDGSGATLKNSLLLFAGIKIISLLLVWAKTVCQSWQGMSMVYFMRAAVYDRLQRVGFAFYSRYSSGQLINRAIGDLNAVRQFVNVSLHSSLEIVFTLIFYSFMMYSMGGWRIACAALIPLPFWIWTLRHFAILSQPIYERQRHASDEVVRLLTENAAGTHVIKAFATEAYEHKRFKQASETLLSKLLEGIKLRVIMAPVMGSIMIFTHIALFTLVAVMVQKGRMQLGALTSFNIAMFMLLARVQQINVISDSFQQAVVSSVRLFEILDTPTTTPEAPDAEPLRPGGGAVSFTNVSFGYHPKQKVLKDVSFSVKAGSVVALVGPTAAGKTTLVALLGRFYDPDTGRIEIDGQDIRRAGLSSVRDSVGYAFQEAYLFSDTIARNIAYSDLNAPFEKIRAAARTAGAEEFIERMPLKYKSVIGEFGATLSGGQRQRLAIARAILHNPRTLVLDDALAAVDPETETQIRESLEHAMAGRTVFMITTRVTTARRADLILVLEEGRLTQMGTHTELIAQPGYYQRSAFCQFGGAASGHSVSHMDRMDVLAKRRPKPLQDDGEEEEHEQ